MKDKKSWYEKASIWITIVVGICGILGISIFGSKSLLKNNETGNAAVSFENNEISMGDQSAVIIGDNNTFNYGNVESDDTTRDKSNELSTSETDDFSVTASYDMNTVQGSLSGIDVLIKAETSFPADHVTISAKSDDSEITDNDIFDMHGGAHEWYFKANFYIKGTYTVIVTAYNSEGESVSDEFIYVY